MPRFITRTHPLSEAPLRWATGVVLRDQGARVLIRADASEREVHVVALGDEVARKSLIGVVRADFMHIHSQLKGLTVHEELERTPGVWLQVRTLEADERHHSDSSAATPQGSIRFPPSVELSRVSHPAARDAGAWRARVFISYSSRDARLKDELLIRLEPLQATEGLISVWHDRCLTAGEAWDRRIREEIDQAHLILLLVSASFLGSDYIRDIEMLRALERHGAAPLMSSRSSWSGASGIRSSATCWPCPRGRGPSATGGRSARLARGGGRPAQGARGAAGPLRLPCPRRSAPALREAPSSGARAVAGVGARHRWALSGR